MVKFYVLMALDTYLVMRSRDGEVSEKLLRFKKY